MLTSAGLEFGAIVKQFCNRLSHLNTITGLNRYLPLNRPRSSKFRRFEEISEAKFIHLVDIMDCG